jgi:hypothetical protein
MYITFLAGKSLPNINLVNLGFFCNFQKTAPKKTITHWAKIRQIWSPWSPHTPKSERYLSFKMHSTQTLSLPLVKFFASDTNMYFFLCKFRNGRFVVVVGCSKFLI